MRNCGTGAEQLWRDAALDLQKRYDFLAFAGGKSGKTSAGKNIPKD